MRGKYEKEHALFCDTESNTVEMRGGKKNLSATAQQKRISLSSFHAHLGFCALVKRILACYSRADHGIISDL